MRRVAFVLAMVVMQASPPTAHAQPADWTVKRDPFDRTLIARYKQILSRAPHDRIALSALVSLYKRHRTLDLLQQEFEATTETPARNVVLARLARQRGALDTALELYRRVVAADDRDGKSWLAIGELVRVTDKTAARQAFDQAVSTAASTADKQSALRALVKLTVDANDVAGAEVAFDALTALTPRDGELWSERGDAMLAMKDTTRALAAYAKAEQLFATHPERKLGAIAARGIAFERAGDLDAAIKEFDRAIAASPAGYYLRKELVLRIVEMFKRQAGVTGALGKLEDRWPEHTRGHFEWVTLAKLYEDSGDLDRMVEALRRALRKDPKDTASQWKLIQHFDRTQRPELAFKHLQQAAKASPKDVTLQTELAQRVWEDNPDLATELLTRLSKAWPKDAEAHRAIGEVWMRLQRSWAAIAELKLALKLDPSDEQTAILLGDALLEEGDIDQAITTWERIGKAGTPEALKRLGDVLADHELWEDAANAYTKAMFKGGSDIKLWAARGRVHSELGRFTSAIDDAEHAVAKLGPVSYDDGFEIRMNLARILRQAGGDLGESDVGDQAVARWEAAFAKPVPDLAAGYMLVAYHGHKPDSYYAMVLEKLRKLAPGDASLTTELIRAYRLMRRFDDALALARARGNNELVAAIEKDRERERQFNDWDPHGDEPKVAVEHTGARERGTKRVPLLMSMRFGLGVGLGGPTERTLSLTSWDAFPLGRGIELVGKLGWAQHLGEMRSVHNIVGSLGVGVHQLLTPNTSLMVTTAQRTEIRVDDLGPWRRVGLAADVSVDITHRSLPITAGVRYQQMLNESGSTVMVELAAGFRCGILSGGSGACR